MIMSTSSLEHCRYCKGDGTLGEMNGFSIYCEACEGCGLGWQDRCFIYTE